MDYRHRLSSRDLTPAFASAVALFFIACVDGSATTPGPDPSALTGAGAGTGTGAGAATGTGAGGTNATGSGGSGNPTGSGGASAGSTSAGGASAGSTSTGGASAGSTSTGGTGNNGTVTVTTGQALTQYEKFKTGFFESCGNGQTRVKFDPTNETVSEGIGYGMLAAVAHDDRTSFDGLWAYYQAKRNGNGLMGWKVAGCGSVIDSGAAADADLDVAMSLIQAECKWGGYQDGALGVLDAIRTHLVVEEQGQYALMVGDNWGKGANCTNPSYYSPGYYRSFATIQPSQASFWNKLATDSYTQLEAAEQNDNGLVPDFADMWGNPGGQCGNGRTNYTYDAARTPWRIATDYVWYGTPAAKEYLTRATNFVTNIYNVVDGYQLNGTPIGEYKNSVFIGGFAVGAVGHSEEKHSEFIAAFLSVNPQADAPYFQTAVRTVYMLLPAGLFPSGC